MIRRLAALFAPRVGLSRPGWLGRLVCRLAGHPPGPVYRGYQGEGADLRCRACGGMVA